MNILEKRMGEQIAIAFHWDVPEKMEAGMYKLEIEAFPMDKWMAFKTKLFHRLLQDNISTTYYDRIIEELESFGKPSEDTITNQQFK